MDNLRTKIEEQLTELTAACRARGLKVTPQRLEIFRDLLESEGHPSVEEIYERIHTRMPTVSLDTVYRTLATLNEAGVISRVAVLDDHSRFEVNPERHHHFICLRCKRVEDFYWPAFDGLALPKNVAGLGKVESPHVEVRGICAACLRAENNNNERN
ncbi:transcriptional repressor [candidate division KSB1 bacterium]|nr:MAG: transcriptional repressor [candidate division KSB1 bacterium]